MENFPLVRRGRVRDLLSVRYYIVRGRTYIYEFFCWCFLHVQCTFVRNPWAELILENWLARRGCLRAYKHMVKVTLNQCGTLES